MGCSVIVPVLRMNESQLEDSQGVPEVVRPAFLRAERGVSVSRDMS